MERELRRYPRIEVESEGQLRMTATSTSDDPAPPIRVTLRSVSCQGAGIAVDKSVASRLVPGAEACLAFEVAGTELELPARIVWAAGGRAGLRLRLGKADEAHRNAYAAWIVPLTNRMIRRLQNQS